MKEIFHTVAQRKPVRIANDVILTSGTDTIVKIQLSERNRSQLDSENGLNDI
jgi:hypothetical protein